MTNSQKRQIAHCLYWKLHTAYLKNNRHDSNKFFGMLNEYPDCDILKEIDEPHFERYKTIRTNIQNGIYGRIHGSGFETPEIPLVFSKDKSGSEKEFCDKLWSKEGRIKLSNLLNLSKNATILREYEIDSFGRLDFLIRDGRRISIIEVKMGQSPYSLVSQIDKYRLAVELDMCYGLYDYVNAYTIAESYTSYEAIELSRASVKILEHKGTLESLRII